VTPEDGLLGPDFDDQRPIQPQRGNGGSSRIGNSMQMAAAPDKMLFPTLSSWMKEIRLFAGPGIDNHASCPFPQRTGNAGQRQIIGNGGAIGDHRDDVIDMKRGLLSGLRETTILTTPFGPDDHLTLERGGDAHAERVTFGREALSFSSVRLSANSTKPSASLRSALVNPSP
jgi:hypothetical protein